MSKIRTIKLSDPGKVREAIERGRTMVWCHGESWTVGVTWNNAWTHGTVTCEEGSDALRLEKPGGHEMRYAHYEEDGVWSRRAGSEHLVRIGYQTQDAIPPRQTAAAVSKRAREPLESQVATAAPEPVQKQVKVEAPAEPTHMVIVALHPNNNVMAYRTQLRPSVGASYARMLSPVQVYDTLALTYQDMRGLIWNDDLEAIDAPGSQWILDCGNLTAVTMEKWTIVHMVSHLD